ncbi:MAG: LPXTG cell wall anchor domain-containing protein, partial [Clostridiaceae bacterium]|nr:LPXTG cell wall anchor domain-containing protein [Clostridiaceae bacterium]
KFAYKCTGVADGASESGGTVRLADGESIVIQGLPIGSTYKVVEHEADKDDYITTVIGDTGSFKVDDFEKSAQFTNTNNRALESDEDIPKTGDTSNNTWLAVFVTSIILLLGLVTADFYLRRQRNTQ